MIEDKPQEHMVVYQGQPDGSVRTLGRPFSARPSDEPADKRDVEIVKTLNVLLRESVWKKLCAEAARDDVSLTTSVCAILLGHSFSLPD